MILERLVQISMAAFVALGTCLLGIGQNDFFLPIAGIVVSLASVYLTDVKQWLVLNSVVANLLAWASMGLAIVQYQIGADPLWAMSYLLVYLQFILLFKQKSTRNYWLLVISSLLQVSVAGAVNLDFFFGIVLLVYMVVGLFAMAVFHVYQEQSLLTLPAGQPVRTGAEERRWPLARATPMTMLDRRAVEHSSEGLTWELVRRIFGMSAKTVLVAGVLFVGIPRRGGPDAWLPTTLSQHMVGFAPSVQLGEFGQIVENPNLALRVRFFDERNHEPYQLKAPPLLRGSTLTTYSRGSWRGNEKDGSPYSVLPSMSEMTAASGDLVREEFVVEPLDGGENVLFGVYPPFASPGQNHYRLRYIDQFEEVRRPLRAEHRKYSYELLTIGLQGHEQSKIVPAMRPLEGPHLRTLLFIPIVQDQSPFPGLEALARDLVRLVPQDNLIARARTLENHLQHSGKFEYSLRPPRRDVNLDPIEDFITRHREGHCEYFASALALMLRTVGIPSRLAVGFRGGNYNGKTQTYEVQQLHAHTWVEAYLRPDQIPPEMLALPGMQPMASRNGAWLILDPTPSAEELAATTNVFRSTVRRTQDYFQSLWAEYILGMDAVLQHQTIYDPISEKVVSLLARLMSSDAWMSAGQKVRGLFNPAQWWATVRQGVSWQIVALGIVALVIAIIACSIAIWALRRRWRRTKSAQAGQRSMSPAILFYRRLEEILQRYQMVRLASQTPREFAVVVGGQLAESPATQPAVALPRKVVEAFYRVRFGRQALDNRESEAVEQAIVELDLVLRQAQAPQAKGRRSGA